MMQGSFLSIVHALGTHRCKPLPAMGQYFKVYKIKVFEITSLSFKRYCIMTALLIEMLKASFSFYKLIPKPLKWPPYILICHCTSLSPWFIILDKNNFVKVSHHYLISGRYQVFLKPMPYGLISMYWVKCKQSNSHTSLTTFCSHFLLPYNNQDITKSAHWCSWSCDFHGEAGGSFFLAKTLQKATQKPTKVHFSI